MLNANEYLANIYSVLVKIDDKLSKQSSSTKSKESKSQNMSFNLKDLAGSASSVKDLKDLGESLKTLSGGMLKFWMVPKGAKTAVVDFIHSLSLATSKNRIIVLQGLTDLGKGLDALSHSIRTFWKIPQAAKTSLIQFVKDLTSSKTTTNINKLSKSVEDSAKIAKNISSLFLGVAGGIGLLALGLWTSSKLLGVNPVAVLGVVALTILTISGVFWTLGKLGKDVKKGSEVGKEMGKALLYLTGGVLAFVLAWQGIAGIMKVGSGIKGLTVSAGVIVGTVLLFAGLFWLLGKGADGIKKGSDAAKGMGVGLLFLSGGLLAIIGIGYLFSKLDKPLATMLVVSLVVGALVGIFYLMGKFWKEILIGTAVMLAFSLGVFVLSLALKPLINIGNMIEKMKSPGKTFMTLGLVMAALIGIFAIVGQPEVAMFVALGAAVITAMVVPFWLLSVTLNKFADSTKKFMEIAGSYDISKIKPTVKTLIGGVLGGFIEGVGEAIGGGKKGWSAVPTAIKNSAILFAGIGMLLGVSVALSQFAKALTAFADLGSMRVIEGTDKDGKPIFGEKINILEVGKNISSSISTFLVGLIDSTQKLTKTQGAAIRKMARALTGKRGMLSAVIGFSEALKVFAEFGPAGEVGSIEYVDSGKKDQDGNIIYNEKRISTPINTVVGYMVGSFTTFIDKLAEHVDSFYKLAQDRSVKKIARALTGKRGILSAVIGFSEALELYAKYGEKNEVPILDADGKQIGTLKMEKVAENIVKSLSTFSEVLSDALDKDDRKNARQAKRTLNKFDDLIEQFNKLAKAQEGIEKVASTIGILAQNIGLLATNLNAFDTNQLAKLTNTSIEKGKVISDKAVRATSVSNNSVVNYNTTNVSNTSAAAQNAKASQEPNWDDIANKIGLHVGQQLATALKSSQVKFEFSNDKSGVVTIG